MSDARIKVSFGDATLEMEGTEAFVNEQLQRFGDTIRGRLGPADALVTAPRLPAEPDFKDIFAVSDRGVMQIVPDIPGNNRSEKIVNVAKLLAFGVEQLQNRRTIRFADVAAACKARKCHDPVNMATLLKKHRTAFVFAGRKRQQTLALTESGRKDAEKLISALRPPSSPANT